MPCIHHGRVRSTGNVVPVGGLVVEEAAMDVGGEVATATELVVGREAIVDDDAEEFDVGPNACPSDEHPASHAAIGAAPAPSIDQRIRSRRLIDSPTV